MSDKARKQALAEGYRDPRAWRKDRQGEAKQNRRRGDEHLWRDRFKQSGAGGVV